MAKIIGKGEVTLIVQFTVDEEEVRALDALVGYGEDKFIQLFYDDLGETYLKKHEGGLRSFLKTIKDQIPSTLSRIDRARKALEDK